MLSETMMIRICIKTVLVSHERRNIIVCPLFFLHVTLLNSECWEIIWFGKKAVDLNWRVLMEIRFSGINWNEFFSFFLSFESGIFRKVKVYWIMWIFLFFFGLTFVLPFSYNFYEWWWLWSRFIRQLFAISYPMIKLIYTFD